MSVAHSVNIAYPPPSNFRYLYRDGQHPSSLVVGIYFHDDAISINIAVFGVLLYMY